MKRSAALASLSRDHHQALVVAQRLRRATDATAAEACETFLAYWTGHGRVHFRLEEELLFPAYAGYGDPYDPLVLRALGEHAMIRHRAAVLAATRSAAPDALRVLGTELAAHVRLEEREVFPLIERVMPNASWPPWPGPSMTPNRRRDTRGPPSPDGPMPQRRQTIRPLLDVVQLAAACVVDRPPRMRWSI